MICTAKFVVNVPLVTKLDGELNRCLTMRSARLPVSNSIFVSESDLRKLSHKNVACPWIFLVPHLFY